jgi:hypothetical protein
MIMTANVAVGFEQSRRFKRFLGGVLIFVGSLASGQPAQAIPAFARRYGLPCQFCHDGFPKLSPLGQQFKNRGFRMEQDDFVARDWLKSVPVTLRAGLFRVFVEDGEGSTTGSFKVVSAGNLGRRLAYWVDQVFAANEDEFRRIGTDNAWLRLDLVPGRFYVRGGRMELDLPFTQTRSSHLLAYDIYFENTGFESDTIGIAQDGFEVGGPVAGEARWSVAVVKGRNRADAEALSDEAGRFDGNVFGRLLYGKGQSRAGVFGYVGRNKLARRDGGRVLVWDDSLVRLGVDGYTWWNKLNLYGLALYGRNDNSFADVARPQGTEEPQSFWGGFAQADLHVADQVAPTLRLSLTRRDVGGSSESFVGIAPGLQLWFFNNVKLSFEVGFFNQGLPTLGAFQLEVGL